MRVLISMAPDDGKTSECRAHCPSADLLELVKMKESSSFCQKLPTNSVT